MELKAIAQTTRKKTSRMVFQYSLAKGRLLRTSLYLSSRKAEGKMVAGMLMLSGTVLKLVKNIHRKGKIIMREPRIRKK